MKKKVNVRNLSLMALFAALTAVGAFITIPVPPVPFSLQIFFAILAGALLGSRQGAMSIVIYLLLGLCGLPVFTKAHSSSSGMACPSICIRSLKRQMYGEV